MKCYTKNIKKRKSQLFIDKVEISIRLSVHSFNFLSNRQILNFLFCSKSNQRPIINMKTRTPAAPHIFRFLSSKTMPNTVFFLLQSFTYLYIKQFISSLISHKKTGTFSFTHLAYHSENP